MRRCKHLGCRLAGIRSCQCFGGNVRRSASYVVWATPTHPEKPWAVGHEIRPGCLKIVAYAESKLLAEALAKRLGDHWSTPAVADRNAAKNSFDQVDWAIKIRASIHRPKREAESLAMVQPADLGKATILPGEND